MISQRRGAGDFFIAALAATIGAAVGVVVGGVVMVAVGGFKLLAFGANKLKGLAQNIQLNKTAGVMSDNAVINEPAENVGAIADLPPDALWPRRFDDVARKRVDLGKNYVDIWFYPNLGIARRTMQVGNKKMAGMFGSRIKLADLPLNDSNALEVELQTIKEVEQLIADATKPKEPREIKPAKPVLSTSVPVSKPDNMQQELPIAEAPKYTEPEAVPKAVAAARQPRKKEVTYRGVLAGLGNGPHQDANGGTYHCFSVSLDDFALGSVHDIVGTDLERAVKEANAQIGDAVEVSLAGDIKTPIGNGKFRAKKIWHVTKIDQKS